MGEERVLAGDVGGTSSRFAIAYRDATGAIQLEAFERFQNDDFACFTDALSHYKKTLDNVPGKALFAMAGPPQTDGSITLVNRDWPTIKPRELESQCGLSSVTLVNDFAAMARAVVEMPQSAFVTVLEGKPVPSAPVLVTGPGTGFGIGTLIPLPSGGYHVLTGEGGHASYAAHNVREAELVERLFEEHGYVSTEMVVAGAWLQPVFDVVSDLHGRLREDLSPSEIMDRAMTGDAVCEEVCEIRARGIMGAAGDVALINGALGGVVLTGGVAERMVEWLKQPDAVKRFRERGSHSDYVADIPVRVLTSAEAPVIGAAALILETE